MEMCSSSGTNCFDCALDFLGGLHEMFEYNSWSRSELRHLKKEIGLLQTIDLYLKKCSRRRRNDIEAACLEQDEDEIKDVISFRIQDLINRRLQDLESAYMSNHDADGSTEIESELTRFRREIKSFFEKEIKGKWMNFLLECYCLGDPGLVIDFIDSALKNLDVLDLQPETHLQGKLMFLKSFIRFAMLCNLKSQQLMDLLNRAEVVVILSLLLIFDEEEVRDQMTHLIYKTVSTNDPRVRETYIYVLSASKLSRSPDTLALEKNKHLTTDFVEHCLIHNIMELKEICENISAMVLMNQMQKLREGLMCLTIILRHHKKFMNDLRLEMANLIVDAVCDAGIIVFSISVDVDQLTTEGLPKDTHVPLFHLLKLLKLIMVEIAHVHPLTLVSGLCFPRTNELGSLDFLLKNLEELTRHDEINRSIAFPVHQIQTIQKDFEFLRPLLEKIKEKRHHNEKFQDFWSHVVEVAYKAELVIDWTLVGDHGGEYCLATIVREISLMKIEAQEISDSLSHDDDEIMRATKTFIPMPSQVPTSTYNEDLVGLDNEAETIIHRLTRGTKRLDIVPIVGMPGLGKTTLANWVYNSATVMSCFHVRAWCIVSRTYRKHNLLFQILCSIGLGGPEEYIKMDENDLVVKLRQVLLRNKYLLVLDDLWDVEAYNLLERSLPDDANGSRILITSRLQNLCLQFKPDSKDHHLRHLTDKESWTLLQRKLFGKKGCPAKLSRVGFQIAKSCKGLPLTVMLVAGILAATTEDCWDEIGKSLSSSTVLEDEYCMKTVELSYSHLSDDLKSCLLYFSAFQEDDNISVRRLLWIWISEGFVQMTAEGDSLEDVADDYLKALIERSLVIVFKQRTLGGAKACRLHDLVHEFCVEKAKEENFLYNVRSQNDLSVLIGPINRHRVYQLNARNLKISNLMPLFPNLRTLLLFEDDDFDSLPKLLRLLDLRNMVFDTCFRRDVVLLIHLRYLALDIGTTNSIPSAIANLSKLQTFLVSGHIWTHSLPETVWNIKTLRHLCTTRSRSGFAFPVVNIEESPCLDHLDTLSLVIDPSSQSFQKILMKFPNIRRLKCLSEEYIRISTGILRFDGLSKLESLRLGFFDGYRFKFPLNLKKLTLSYNHQPWSEISVIGELPNLQVLKLHEDSFVGDEWEMKEGEFPSLRVLKMSHLILRSWSAETTDNFPTLEKLVVEHCRDLKEVPYCLGECPTLEMIQVRGCCKSVARSVEQIQQEQIDGGNEALKAVIEYATWNSWEEEEAESIPTEEEEEEEEEAESIHFS